MNLWQSMGQISQGAFEKQGLRSAHDHPSATHVGTPLAKRLRSFAGRGRGAWRVGQVPREDGKMEEGM